MFLRVKKPTRRAMNINAKKMMQRPEVGHGEFLVERGDDGLEERSGARGEDNVIDIQQ